MQAAVGGAASWRAQPAARPAGGPQRHRAASNLLASRYTCSRRHALGSSDGSDAEGGASGSGSGSGGGDGGQTDEVQELLRLRAQAARLNELFFAPAAPGASEVAGSDEQPGGEKAADSSSSSSPSPGSLRIPNLPLWRVQWAALPGAQEVLHVHVPHYTSMFERLFRTPRPWRYGSLYLPDGSKNLDNPEFALEPGTKAPLAGTLMEVLQAVRFADGRLLVLAVGVGRFRVAQATQSTPYWRADVELLIDSEEQQQCEPLALQALESVQDGLAGSSSGSGGSSTSEPGGEAGGSGTASSSIPLAALMTAVPAAARAAAAASSVAWVDYELADAREESATGEQNGLPAVIDGSKPAEAQRMGRRLAAIAGNEVLPMPFFDQLQSAAQAAAAPGIREVIPSSTEPASLLQSAIDAQRPVLRQTAASAYALASSAAAAAIRRLTGAGSGGSENSSGSGRELREEAAATVAAARLNTAAERGVEVQPAEEVLGEDALESEPDSLPVALQLETAVWVELDAISVLANKLRERELPLPNGMQSLRPMAVPTTSGGGSDSSSSSGSGAPAEAAALQAGAHPDWPALRRLQHLSYAVTSQLANISASEGRQAFIEAPSICARLRLGLAALRKHRQVLAAVVAVEGL